MDAAGARTAARNDLTAAQGLARVRLSRLVAALTAALLLPFLLLAALHPAAAAVALAGATLVAAHSVLWLLVLRYNRARLRRAGLRW